MTARASVLFYLDCPSATKSISLGASYPSKRDAGNALDTTAVVTISLPPILIFTTASGKRLCLHMHSELSLSQTNCL